MDDLSVFTGNANRPLAASICKHLRIPLGDADVFQFSNENIFVKINDNVRGRDTFVIQPLSSPVNRSIMELLIIIDALKRASASRITAVIPYYAYGRTDKKDQPRVPITARLIADCITEAMDIIGNVEDRHALIVDDEIDTAGSLTQAVRVVHEHGARSIYCCATHGVLSGPAIERLNVAPIKELVLTDSIPLPDKQ